MPTFDSFDGVPLHYTDQDERDQTLGDDTSGAPARGRVVVLLHGFSAHSERNFVRTGILAKLLAAGERVVTLDARGHGRSGRPTDVAAYEHDAIRLDVDALLDHLAIAECVIVGYSMGGQTALRLAAVDPRVRALVLLGVGDGTSRVDGTAERRAPMIAALRTDDPDDLEHAALRQFRIMAGDDRLPLAALMGAEWPDTLSIASAVKCPVLLIIGHDDDEARSPDGLLALLPNGSAVRVPGNHFTANATPELHDALLEFLATN
jgi:pimeloyl-ACP methyl ester carboxylesterase